FGDTPLGATSPASPLTLANTGNAPITFTIGAPSDAEFVLSYGGSPGTITLAPQATVPALQATFAPTQPGPIAASAPIVVASGSATCGQGATSIALSGTGATGGASVSASQLDF